MEVDPELLDDTLNIAQHFNMEMLGVDYMIGNDGRKHLLEVNHIPNVTVFPFMTTEFIRLVLDWTHQ